MQAFWEFVNQKYVRFGLASFCLMLAIQGIFRLFMGVTNAEILRGGGEVLLWGGWTVINMLRPYGRTVPNINIVINTGLACIVGSWFMT